MTQLTSPGRQIGDLLTKESAMGTNSIMRFTVTVWHFPPGRKLPPHPAFSRLLPGLFVILLCLSTKTWTMEKKIPNTRVKSPGSLMWLEGKSLRVGIDRATGLLSQVETFPRQTAIRWLQQPAGFTVRHEVTDLSASLRPVDVKQTAEGVSVSGTLEPLSQPVSQLWSSTPSGITWELQFKGTGKRAGHEV